MDQLLLWVGRLGGLVGVLLCAVAVLRRLMGEWSLGSVPISTLLQLGIAGMALGCLCYLALLAERPNKTSTR